MTKAAKKALYEGLFTKSKTSRPITKGGITTTKTTLKKTPRKKRTTKQKKAAKKKYRSVQNFKW
jgi:hypothetical protein